MKLDGGRHTAIELTDARMVTLEQLEEARLRSGGTLHPATGQRRDAMIEIGEVKHEVLHPQRGALADRRRLGWLEMSVAERRLGAPLAGERGQRPQHAMHATTQQDEPA